MSLVLDPAPARATPASDRRGPALGPAAADRRPRPPAPEPLTEVPGTLALLKGLRDNPVATWTRWHFEQPIVHGRNVLGSVPVTDDIADDE